MGQKRNIEGQKFGHLIARRWLEGETREREFWECDCVCGDKIVVTRKYLLSGNNTQSCGCRRLVKAQDVEGYWHNIFVNGSVSIRYRRRRGQTEKPRRSIRITLDGTRHTFTLARVVWNCMHPDRLAGPEHDVHHKDGDTLNDCPENLKRLKMSYHRGFKKQQPVDHSERVKRGKEKFWAKVRSGEIVHPYPERWDVQRFLELNAEGVQIGEIAKMLDVGTMTLRSYCYRHKVCFYTQRGMKSFD